MYKLEGFDKEWQMVRESPLINYSNISHGNYTFKIKGANSNGIWNEAETHLEICILPPLYLSPVAYGLYFFLAAGSIVLLILYIRNRNRRKQERMMEIFNQEKERELYDSKIEFFTHVAHEIRTPLTLIKGPLDNIIKKVPSENDIKEDLDIMSKNTGRLLDLTNQLLDFRKQKLKVSN